MDQGGLGLPDRDYYLKTDAKSVELRQAYVAHVQKMFELLGDAPGVSPPREAQTVLRIETALAKGSLTQVERRDPKMLDHKMTRGSWRRSAHPSVGRNISPGPASRDCSR